MKPELKPSASITLTANGLSIAVTPADGKLRQLERRLLEGGVEPLMQRSPARAFAALGEFHRICDALTDWDLSIEEEIPKLAHTSQETSGAIERARQVIADVARPGVALAMLDGLANRDILDPHQLEAVAAASHKDVAGLCLFDEQGLGKTIEALFAFHCLRQKNLISRAVIFAPKNMVLEWKRDCERFFQHQYIVATVMGSAREKRQIFASHADIFVTNFETAVGLQTKLKHILQSDKGRSLLIVDESFFVKNSGAARTKAIRELRRTASRCLVLCGTPAPNSPHDLVEQFNIADGGVAFAGIKIPRDCEAARPIVGRVINNRGVYMRRLKQDVLPDLPAKTFHQVIVPLESQQRRAYEIGLSELIQELEAIDDITFKKRIASFMARRLALLQICTNPAAVIQDYHETPAKHIALDGILEDLIEKRQEKVVLWSYFTASVEALVKRYSRYRPVRIDGVVADPAERREAVRRFQDDSQTMLLVANPAAAGAGLTLHRARFAVYESMSNQAAHYLQSLDRIHRRGQTRPVEYIVILGKDTIEEQEYQRLLLKEKSAQELLGDEIEPPLMRSTMLSEAITLKRRFDDISSSEPS